MLVDGTLRSLVMFDVADAIRLNRVAAFLGGNSGEALRAFPRAARDYVRFEHPPVVENYPGGRIKYYDYGVISVEADLPFRGTWTELVERSSQWVADSDEEKRALEILRPRLERVTDALSQPYHQWLTEDYYVVHVCGLPAAGRNCWSGTGCTLRRLCAGKRRRFPRTSARTC